MEIVIFVALVSIFLSIVIFKGEMIVQNKSAVMYVESNGGMQAAFTKCDGTIRRQFRVKESQKYHFHLQQQLSEGNFHIQILDRNKRMIGQVDNKIQWLDLELKAKERYYMLSVFTQATGSYQFTMTK